MEKSRKIGYVKSDVIINDYVDVTIKMLKAIGVFSTGIGVFISGIYCTMIHFYPKGVSVSDGLIFIFISIPFAMFYIFALALSSYVANGVTYSVSRAKIILMGFSKIEKSFNFMRVYVFRRKTIMIICALVSIVIFSIIINKCIDFNKGVISKVAVFFVSGMFIPLIFTYKCMARDSNNGILTDVIDEKNTRIGRICIAIFSIFLPIITGDAYFFMEKSMEAIGVRRVNQPIILKKAALDNVENAENAASIKIISCKLSEDRYLIPKGMDVLWGKVGDKAKIQIQGNNGRYTTTEIDTADVIPIDGDGETIKSISCPTN